MYVYIIWYGNALSCTITCEVVKCHMNSVAYQTPEHNFVDNYIYPKEREIWLKIADPVVYKRCMHSSFVANQLVYLGKIWGGQKHRPYDNLQLFNT